MTKVFLVPHRMYCFAESEVKLCASDPDTCNALMKRSGFGGHCEQKDAAACFMTREAVSGEKGSLCFATMAQCTRGRFEMTDDDTKSDHPCFVMRYEP